MAYVGRILLNNCSLNSKRYLSNLNYLPARFASSTSVTRFNTTTQMAMPPVIKSSLDKREYRALSLSNGMKVLLVNDAETDISAASLSVTAGSLHDPKHIQGLAHFCEHMLFLGTDAYPEENDYNKFLSEHGGSSNAYTALDHTNYYFDVSPKALQPALDRFANFFICPKFTESATEREVNAVNSEHDKNISSDSWRKHQLEATVSKPSHPFSLFATGNRDTLWNLPRKDNVNVREALLSYYNKHYSANAMTLAVLGTESLDDLQGLIVPLFSRVANKNIQVDKWPENPFGSEQLGKRVDFVPIKDLRSLSIMFPIPDTTAFYKTSAERYISHLIGHEGPGSLLSLLKSKNWVNSLSAGAETPARGFSFFKLIVDLSPEGLEHTEDIIEHVFQYIAMLNKEGPQKWIWEELRDISAVLFKCKDKERPQQYVAHLTNFIQNYPMEDVLSAGYLLSEYKPELISEILREMVPEKSLIFSASKSYESKASLSEEYYGVKYSKEDLSPAFVKKLSTCGLHPDIKLPLPNDYIPTELELKERDQNVGICPTILKETALSRVWFLQDNEFSLPKGTAKVEIYSSLPLASPLNANLIHMLRASVKDSLTEETYSAAMTGLDYSVSDSLYGLEVVVHGYDHKLPVLFNKVIAKIVNFSCEPDRFIVLKDLYTRSLKNWKDEQPYNHALFNLKYVLSEKRWSHEELLQNLEEVTLDALNRFAKDFIQNLRLEWIIHGNFTSKEADSLVSQVENEFTQKGTQPLLPSQAVRLREIKLPEASSYIYRTEHQSHHSSCTAVVFQIGILETRINVLSELLDHIANEPCYNQLRTQEQLGYVVMTSVRRSNGSQGLLILVQSDRHPAFVDSRIEDFLQNLDTILQNMSDDEFLTLREGLATRKAEKPKTLKDRGMLLWNEIFIQQYNFERQEIELKELAQVSKQDLINFFKELVKSGAPKRKRISSQVTSMVSDGIASEKQEPELDVNKLDLGTTLIEDVTKFKQQLELYPAVNPFNPITNEAKSKL